MIKMDSSYDIVVVGAGVSGAAAAILLRQAGMSVLLVDKRQRLEDYKLLCTHFVQPFTNSIFSDLGVEDLLSAEFSVRTRAVFKVPGGVIDTEGGYGTDAVTAYAHNLERRVLDPALRQRAIDVGVTLGLGTELVAMTPNVGGSLLTLDRSGERLNVNARLVVAADGRGSRLAEIVGAVAETFPNDRSAYFGHCTGISAPTLNRSIFVLRNSEMSFLYPLINQRTLLSVYITADRAAQWGSGRDATSHLLDQFRSHIPDMDFSRAEFDTQIFSYRRYNNLIRSPVFNGIAFVGDAAISIDPMSGVGCSFGLKSARLLADAIAANVDAFDLALAGYAKAHKAFFDPHVQGIVADSRVTKSDESVAASYTPILQNPKLQQAYLDLTARLITPAVFQRNYLMSAIRRPQVQAVF